MTFPCQGRSGEQKFKPFLLTQFIQYILHCVGKKPVFNKGNSSLYQATRKTPCQAHLRNEFLLLLIVFCFGFVFFLVGCFVCFALRAFGCLFGFGFFVQGSFLDFMQMQKAFISTFVKGGVNRP